MFSVWYGKMFLNQDLIAMSKMNSKENQLMLELGKKKSTKNNIGFSTCICIQALLTAFASIFKKMTSDSFNHELNIGYT